MTGLDFQKHVLTLFLFQTGNQNLSFNLFEKTVSNKVVSLKKLQSQLACTTRSQSYKTYVALNSFFHRIGPSYQTFTLYDDGMAHIPFFSFVRACILVIPPAQFEAHFRHSITRDRETNLPFLKV